MEAAPLTWLRVSPAHCMSVLTHGVFVFGSDASKRPLGDPQAADVAHQLLQRLLPLAARLLHT